MKSVAIVGFYNPTLHPVNNTPAKEVWVPNHGYMVMEKDLPRCTRMFEIHPKDWFRRKENSIYEKYWNYLKQPHSFPIYLQKAIPEIPSGVVYPYQEVCEDLFPHLLRQDPTGKLVRDIYLTSSASFMLALAIHEKFDQVWIYGIGMSTDTEYGYQLPGFTYMIGLANGRGIDVINQHNSPICRAQIYAYGAIPYIKQDYLKELRQTYYLRLMAQNEISNALISDLNTGKRKDIDAVYQASDLTNAWFGAVTMIDHLLSQDSEYLSRQQLEIKRRPYILQADTLKADVNATIGKYEALTKQQRKKEADKLWAEYLDKRASMHANTGAVQLLDNLIDECDLLKSDHQIGLTIKDI